MAIFFFKIFLMLMRKHANTYYITMNKTFHILSVKELVQENEW